MKWPRLNGIVAIFLILLCVVFNVLCESNHQEAFQLQEENIEKTLKTVTSKSYRGHIAGSTENEALATYIEKQLLTYGLTEEKGYVSSEAFKMLSLVPDTSPVMEIGTVDGVVSYENLVDYRIMRNAYSGNIDYTGELVFIKGSITSVEEEKVAGKVIVTDLYANQEQSIDIAREKGVRGILYATKDRHANIQDRQLTLGEKVSNDLFMANLPYILFVELEKLSNEHEGIIPYGRIKVNDTYQVARGQNVIAKIEGRNPSKEMYFVTHYDGKGYVGDIYYPGASRNGTAISLFLELSRSILESGYQPEYTIGFVFLDGQELGNIGAKAFIEKNLDQNKSQEFIAVNDIGTTNNSDLFLNNSSVVIIPTDESNMLYQKMLMLSGDAGIATKRFGRSFTSDGIFSGTTAEYFAFEKLPVIEFKGMESLPGLPYIYTPEDTVEPVEMDKVMAVGTALNHYIYYEGYQKLDLSYLNQGERRTVNVIFAVLILLTISSWLYGQIPDFTIGKYTIRDLYLSVPYSVFTRLVSILIPTMIMLFIMVGVLSIPPTLFPVVIMEVDLITTFLICILRIQYSRLLLSGDLGAMNPTVVESMIRGGAKSFRILSVSLICALIVGIGLGMMNGLKRNQVRTFMGLLIFSIPDVIISLGALYSIVYWFKDIFITPETLRIVVMPTFAMIIVPAIYISRIIEVAVIEEREQAYIYGAYARGASKQVVIWHHIFLKVLSKLFDAMGTVIRIGIINLIVVEYIFSAVGIGSYLMTNYHDAFFVIYISFAFGLMYFLLTQFFKLLSWRLNLMKRRLSS